ncbi:unnamed protein product [Amoebophrya sp. A120]|nr:unnamed protein product [Amoebophrya sp. A120]|eukprot:GSA120T00000617001.1
MKSKSLTTRRKFAATAATLVALQPTVGVHAFFGWVWGGEGEDEHVHGSEVIPASSMIPEGVDEHHNSNEQAVHAQPHVAFEQATSKEHTRDCTTCRSLTMSWLAEVMSSCTSRDKSSDCAASDDGSLSPHDNDADKWSVASWVRGELDTPPPGNFDSGEDHTHAAHADHEHAAAELAAPGDDHDRHEEESSHGWFSFPGFSFFGGGETQTPTSTNEHAEQQDSVPFPDHHGGTIFSSLFEKEEKHTDTVDSIYNATASWGDIDNLKHTVPDADIVPEAEPWFHLSSNDTDDEAEAEDGASAKEVVQEELHPAVQEEEQEHADVAGTDHDTASSTPDEEHHEDKVWGWFNNVDVDEKEHQDATSSEHGSSGSSTSAGAETGSDVDSPATTPPTSPSLQAAGVGNMI